MHSARPETNLRPVMMAFSKLLSQKITNRGLQIDIVHLAEGSVRDVRKLFKSPSDWSQTWLAEFREDPEDTYMALMFAHHCQRQFNAFRNAIEETKLKDCEASFD